MILAHSLSLYARSWRIGIRGRAAPCPALRLGASGQIRAGPGSRQAIPQKYSQEHVEQRVIHLHDQLQITPAQESAWKEFAQVMRDNAKAMNALIEKWAQGKDKMTALENMRAHAEMGQEHVQA